jgi:GNAT superfamily N-acetyltransferase
MGGPRGEDSKRDVRSESHAVADDEIRVEKAGVEEPGDAIALIEEYYEAIDVVHRDTREGLLGYLADDACRIWIARCGDAAAGCVLYRPLPHLGKAGEMKRLYVRPPYRRFGIARVLLHTLEEFAAKREIQRLYLDTKDDLLDAIAFYTRHGYAECARYNDNPQATVFMRKQLV